MKDTLNMNNTNNTIHEELTNSTMDEVVYLSTGELNEMVRGKLATATMADKKWIYNYFSGHDRWPIVVDDAEPEVKYGVPRAG
jgi:hypothetical protein